MKDLKIKYLKILRIELEDLKEDIELWMKDHECRHENKEITNYVFQDNMCLLKNEILGIHDIFHDLDIFNEKEHPDLESLSEYLKTRYKELLKEHGIADAVYILIERKLDKVLEYVMEIK